MPTLFKATLFSLFLIGGFSSLSESKTKPSFSFSQKKGLQKLSDKETVKTPEPIAESSTESKGETALTQQTENTKLESKGTKISAEDTEPKEEQVSSEKATEEEKSKHSISEDFAPLEKEQVEGTGFLANFSENVSWFFQPKRTPHKVAFTPIYSYNRTQGSRLGLRFFSYSSKEKGYLFAFSGSQYLSHHFSSWRLSYIGNRERTFRTESVLIYDSHYENYFGRGMASPLSDLKRLYALRLLAEHKIFYQPQNQNWYLGAGALLSLRTEKPSLQENKTYFEKELFLFLSLFAGYDSRNNWKNPTNGAFHQVSFGCKSILAFPGAYCRGEGDFRFYVPLFRDISRHNSIKNSTMAFRFFMGSAFLSPGTYTTNYSLGGTSAFQNTVFMRGFRQNRFLGEKIYVIQSEYRFPLWKKYLMGVLFTELGEVAEYKASFQGFVWDYGAGIRVGLPPDYDLKLRADIGTGKDYQEKRNYNVMISFFHAF